MKKVVFHPSALKSLQDFPKSMKREIGKALFDLQQGIKLTMPLSRTMKSVGAGVEEIRVKDASGAYRVFYCVVTKQGVLVFHAFNKKSQKTPQKEIDLGRKRLKELLE